MNHTLWTSAGARVVALAFVITGLAACGDRLSDTHAGKTPKAPDASPSAVVIGTAPAQPSGDPPGTTPVSGGTTEVTKSVESHSMPQPGQPNDHSNVAPMPSQKADEIARTPAEGEAANAGERTK
jgi:hypothetical protein